MPPTLPGLGSPNPSFFSNMGFYSVGTWIDMSPIEKMLFNKPIASVCRSIANPARASVTTYKKKSGQTDFEVCRLLEVPTTTVYVRLARARLLSRILRVAYLPTQLLLNASIGIKHTWSAAIHNDLRWFASRSSKLSSLADAPLAAWHDLLTNAFRRAIAEFINIATEYKTSDDPTPTTNANNDADGIGIVLPILPDADLLPVTPPTPHGPTVHSLPTPTNCKGAR
jgi:hypothetical protein